MQERRSAARFRTNLNVRWETLRTQGSGSVCDLSSTGCFILTGGEVEAGELVRMNLLLRDEAPTLWGQIVYTISEMGFAVRFLFGAADDNEIIARAIADAQ